MWLNRVGPEIFETENHFSSIPRQNLQAKKRHIPSGEAGEKQRIPKEGEGLCKSKEGCFFHYVMRD